jgi:hypothetical protein
MNSNDAAAKMAQKYTAAGGSNAGSLPWADIVAFILKMLQGGCTSGNAAKRFARRHPEAAKFALTVRLKEAGLVPANKDRDLVVSAAYDTLIGVSDANLDVMMTSPV